MIWRMEPLGDKSVILYCESYKADVFPWCYWVSVSKGFHGSFLHHFFDHIARLEKRNLTRFKAALGANTLEETMIEEYVVFTRSNELAFAMRTKTWDTMVQMHKEKWGDEWEKKMDCTLVGQHLTEAQAEGLAELMKQEKT